MNQTESVTCRQLIDFLADYLDGELPEPTRFSFERHLRMCPSCVAYIETYRRSIAMGRAAFAANDEPADRVAPESLVKAVREARRSGVPRA